MKLFQRKREEVEIKQDTVDDLDFLMDVDGEEDADCDFVKEVDEEVQFSALNCFGWKEEKTDKWMIKCANIWYLIISFIWFLFGALTFAPVIFISNKVNVIFKNKRHSFLFATIMYIVCIILLIILT